jgi:hypothetical protein
VQRGVEGGGEPRYVLRSVWWSCVKGFSCSMVVNFECICCCTIVLQQQVDSLCRITLLYWMPLVCVTRE